MSIEQVVLCRQPENRWQCGVQQRCVILTWILQPITGQSQSTYESGHVSASLASEFLLLHGYMHTDQVHD